MSLLFWLVFALVAGAIVLFGLEVLLGVGADWVTDYLARKGKKEEPRRPWSDRTGT